MYQFNEQPLDNMSEPVSESALSRSLVQAWLALQCRIIPGVKHALASLESDASGTAVLLVGWPETEQLDPALMSLSEVAIQNRAPVVSAVSTESAAAKLQVAFPLQQSNQCTGVIAIEVVARQEQQPVILQMLEWGAAWLRLLLERGATSHESVAGTIVTDILQQALAPQEFAAAAIALTSMLADRFPCQRVSLGLEHHGGVRLQALSDSARFDPRSVAVKRLEAAMSEVFDQDASILWKCSTDDGLIPEHSTLGRQENSRAVLSIPLSNEDKTYGVLTLELGAGRPLEPQEITLLGLLAKLLGPLLALKRTHDRSLPGYLKHWRKKLFPAVATGSTWGLRLGLSGALAVVLLLTFLQGHYRISAPAMLEGAVQRAIVVPFAGYLAAAHVRAGEQVAQGQPMAELDDKDLLLEYRKRSGEREELRNQHRKVLAELNHSQARILNTQIAQVEAQLKLLDEQLARTRLAAPFAGVVISGDLSRSLGMPLERGQILFEVAPLDAYRIVLEVDGQDVADAKIGQQGLLILAALPDTRLPIVVENISHISEQQRDHPAFRVEAHLQDAPEILRPGMQGIAKLEVGQRSLWWIWTHELTDWIKLWLWRWWP